MMSRKPIAFVLNCGYSRGFIWECEHPSNDENNDEGESVHVISNLQRAENFQQLFSDCPSFRMPNDYWEFTDPNHCTSAFDRHCQYILNCFSKRWNPRLCLSRKDYLKTFSTNNWKKMSLEEKQKHSLSKCNACAIEHSDLQNSFPGLPCYEPEIEQPKLIEINLPCSSTSGLKESDVTRQVLDELDNTYQSTFNRTFSESVSKYSKVLVRKETPVEKKRKERKMA